ncbi:alpha/beta hydrolase [Actinopolymorpha sp. B9G3]|uniref:alpha/beta fold hydrolase n=1 Tax=Actinopolymorpha sp. B9G3 TaxID=3158970 RepID=UPI0032D985B8
MEPTFVLVHGAFGNSFSWAPMQRELALRGHRSLAVDLPGHGFQAAFSPAYQAPQDLAALAAAPTTLSGVTLADNVEHVCDVVRRASEHGPVILVGHSRGGLTLTGVGNTVPALIDRIVYVSAWCCVDLAPMDYASTPEHGPPSLNETNTALVGDPRKLGVIRQSFRMADPDKLASLKAVLADDCTEAEFLAYLNTLEPDENLDVGGDDARAQADTWGRVRRTYIRLTRDAAIPIALQDRFIAEADALTPDNQFDVHSLDSSHVRVLVHPEDTAAILAGLAT